MKRVGVRIFHIANPHYFETSTLHFDFQLICGYIYECILNFSLRFLTVRAILPASSFAVFLTVLLDQWVELA